MPSEPSADKLLAPERGLDRHQQFSPRILLHDIAQCADLQGFLHHIGRGLLSNKDNSGGWRKATDSASRFQSVQRRKSDIQQNQVGLECLRFSNGVQAIRDGAAYGNVHSTMFTAGETRGQLRAQ